MGDGEILWYYVYTNGDEIWLVERTNNPYIYVEFWKEKYHLHLHVYQSKNE